MYIVGEKRQKKEKKSRIRETPTLSACADSNTDTMKSSLFETFGHYLAFLCVQFLALL